MNNRKASVDCVEQNAQHAGPLEKQSKLTVVFVENTLPRIGGAEQVLYDLILRLDRTRFDPVLCCLHGLGELGEQLKRSGCRTYEHVAQGRFNPGNITRLAAILKKERADIVYATDACHNMVVGRLAAMVARTPQTVLTFHCYDTLLREGGPSFRNLLYKLSDRLLHPMFPRVIALAEDHKQYLSSVKRIPAAKISVIHNGIDAQRFTSGPSVQEARNSFDLPVDQHVVGIVASLRPCKAHEMFLKAAAKVREQAPDTLFVIAGEGPERQNLEALTGELGLASQVRFFGQVKDVPTLLRAFDVSVLTSYTEAFPLALLESMASERPVVATDVGSVAEIVEDGVSGFRVPFGAVDEFADAILKILSSPELARRFGEAGRKKVEELFTVNHMVRQTEAMFEALVRPDQGGAANGQRRKSDADTQCSIEPDHVPLRTP